MIVSNERPRFGSYALLQTNGFDCMVSTAPGFLKGSKRNINLPLLKRCRVAFVVDADDELF